MGDNHTPNPSMSRFPLQPLDRHLAGMNDTDKAALFYVSATTIKMWRRRGLSPRQADQLATHVGCHPLELWPNFHDSVRSPDIDDEWFLARLRAHLTHHHPVIAVVHAHEDVTPGSRWYSERIEVA